MKTVMDLQLCWGQLDLRVVSLLIEQGADVNHEDISGRAALLFAATSGSADVVSQPVVRGVFT